MKEMWKKYKRQIQITGGLCLITALGIGGYVVANQDADVQTKVEAKQETQSSNQKVAKTNSKDTSSEKKMDTKQEAEKKTDTKSEKTAEKKETIAKKSENSDNKNSVEKSDKKESVKAEKETGKTESSSKPEQKPSQPESKPEQSPSKPQTKPESKPEQKPSKPQHTHTWEEVTHTINHEEVGHNEQYVIKEAWTETVTEEVYDPWECCNVCGADITANVDEHIKQHMMNGEGGRWHTEYYKTVTRTVEHPAEYGTRWVVDQPAWTETVSDGFFCSGCGTKKQQGGVHMAEKEQMQPFWYQGYLIDPNEELPFSLEQLEAENAWNDMWEAMTEEEQEAYMKAEFGTKQ